ncbi:MAG: ABC transporter ATP-binding protein [Oscillospiraceae bacterium]|nr:ABC transporter ATP-binding protein [Oscillospiraceae bacterium]
MKEFLSVQNLVKNYGDFCAVDDLSFSVGEREIFGLLGPNGAGKSTTMNVITSLCDFGKGSVTVDGMDIVKDKEKVRRFIGMVPQEIALYPFLNAEENVKFFASLYGLKGKELNSAAREALEFVGLSDRAKMKPKKMSGGMKRRLNIACGIAHHPKLIIMDEPTVGVDAQSREHILGSIKTLRERGATVIYTSHYMNEVEDICDRIAIIDHGKFVACGTEQELISMVSDSKALKISTEVRANFPADDLISEFSMLPNVKKARIDNGEIILEINASCKDFTLFLEHIQKRGLPICGITSESMNLEDVFIALTGRELR